jgi:hypothetical protein
VRAGLEVAASARLGTAYAGRALPPIHREVQRVSHLAPRVQSVAPVRNNLIKKGMIYSPAHGDTAFMVPLFDQVLKRQMPGDSWR